MINKKIKHDKLLSTTSTKMSSYPFLSKVKHLDFLLKHFMIIIYSAFIKNEDALSTLIYAWQERGKSTIVLSVKNSGILIEDDITAYGLSKKIEDLDKEGKLKLIHHLLIPDLEKVSSRGRTVKNELRAFLQSIMFDGIENIDTYNIHLHFKERHKLAIIACVTPDVFGEKSSFRRLGFLSRLLPFSFDYNNNVVEEIINYIGTIKESSLRVETKKVKNKGKVDIIISDKYMKLLEEKSKELASIIDNFVPYKEKDTDRLIGSRAKKLLVCYLKSICLLEGNNERFEVNDSDYNTFLGMFHYLNFNMNDLPDDGEILNAPERK